MLHAQRTVLLGIQSPNLAMTQKRKLALAINCHDERLISTFADIRIAYEEG